MVILADNVHKKESTFITVMITSHTKPTIFTGKYMYSSE